MAIAISLKVHDGIILGSDSASTLIDQDGEVRNVYNSANKVFNLRKGLPIGAITWGSGAIGAAAISTLAKDLRKRFTGPEAAHGRVPSRVEIEKWRMLPVGCPTTNRPSGKTATGGMRHGEAYQEVGVGA